MTPVIAQETAAMVDGFEFVDLNSTKPDPTAMELVPGDFALKHQILPMSLEGNTLIVAMGAPQSLQAADDLGILINRPVIAMLGDKNLIQERIQEFFLERILAGMTSDDSSIMEIDDSTDLADLTKLAGETAVIQMVNGILQGTQTWKQATARLFDDLLIKFIDDFVVKSVLKWAEGEAQKLLATQAKNTAIAASDATASESGILFQIASAIKSIFIE